MIPKVIFIFITIVLILGGSYTLLNNHPHQEILLGAWTQGFYDANQKKLNPQKLLDFESLTKKKYSIAHYYRGWESFIDPTLVKEFSLLRKNGWTPMLSSNPYYFSDCPVQTESIYKSIAEGKCDEFLNKAGENLKKINKPFYLAFAWEMNNKDLEWSVPYTGSSPQDFVDAWRHIHDMFEKHGAKNILWVFCPNIPDVPHPSYKDLYPGDKYVDWTCLDGYNWGTTQSWSKWTSFTDIFGSSYQTISDIAPGKPLMIGEVNTTDVGGNKAGWYGDAFRDIPYNFPNIKAVVIFNEDKSKQENVNWRVDVSKDSLNSYISAIKPAIYK
ncbi:MAG TPA: glycosyl hydrolase [Patescibacteria group bacterium]|nr:glycosyl hydrolase [Patescibacteria group bacterium]